MSKPRQKLQRLGSAGDRSLPIVVFAHANGYPPEAYRTLLAALEGVGEVWTLEHRPLWLDAPAPSRLSWHSYATDMLVSVVENFSRPVWLVGHSMGGVCSMIAAAREPNRFAGVVAYDPVLLPDRFWWPAQLLGRINPNGLPIVKRALARPHEFQGFDAAFNFYRGKRVFQRVADEVLWDYVNSAHAPTEGGGVTLRWSGAWEACVYRSAPRMWGLLKQLKLPTLGLIGESSDVLNAQSIAHWGRVQPHAALHTLSGGHLLPLEHPEACAAYTSQFIAAHAQV